MKTLVIISSIACASFITSCSSDNLSNLSQSEATSELGARADLDPELFINIEDQDVEAPAYSPRILNLLDCPTGRETMSFGLGSTRFIVSGRDNENCIFSHQTEIEMGYGSIYNCEASADSATVTLTNDGPDFNEISKFCEKEPRP